MLEMLDRDLHHLPVVWPHGEVLGILTDRDLLAAETHAPFSLRRAIEDAIDPEGLRLAAAQWRPEVIALHDAGVAPVRIGSIIGIVVDALTRRLIELAMRDLREPPSPFTWLALGSLGRREIVPSSDVDSGLVWDPDGEEQQRYMRGLGPRIVSELAECGFTADAYGATAAEPLFLRSYDNWRSVIRTAIAQPDRGKALIFISLLADGRPVFGIGDPRDPIEELRHVRHRRPLLRLLLQLALAHGPPTGLRRLRVPRRDRGRDDKHPGRFDVKHEGVLPIASIARYASLAAGVRATSSRARLDLAATAGTLSGRDAGTLAEAYDLFWRLRIDHQVEQMREGIEPDDYVDLEGLNAVMRGYLREAFHAVAAVQRSLQGELNLPP